MAIATILPPARTVFFDQNDNPVSGGMVYFYVPPNTTTLKTTWQDGAETLPNTNPVILDANGSAVIYGSGQYLQVLRDASNNIIWSGLTQDVAGLILGNNNTFSGINTFSNELIVTGIAAFSGSATALTPAVGDSSTSIATTAFVDMETPSIVTGQSSATSSTTLTNIPGMSINISAATYSFSAWGKTTSSTSAGINIGIGGTSTLGLGRITGFIDNSGTFVGGYNTGGGFGTILYLTNTSAASFYSQGVIVCSAPGTLTLEFAQNVSNATASVLVDATMSLTLI